MKKIQYEEFMQIVAEEKVVNLPDVANVVQDLIWNSEEEDGEYGVFDYFNSPRKKLREIAKLFADDNLYFYGTAIDYHNIAVDYARQDIHDCACRILRRGLQTIEFSVDMLADLIRYSISSGQYQLCKAPYETLLKIPTENWNWRAFSFSIDYLQELANHIESPEKRDELKQQALSLADKFIEKENSDQAYYDKANILRFFGKDQLGEQTEESVLKCGLKQRARAHKCALRLADILFDRGDYVDAIEYLHRCCLSAFKPQPDINSGYAFLLLALSKACQLFCQEHNGSFSDSEKFIHSMYKDFHTAIRHGLNDTFSRTANTAIQVIATQTGYEYPYEDVQTNDQYEF